LDCINLVSSDEEPSSSSRNVKRKDYIDYQKERVMSTLDRLARHVEVEKQQKEEKNKAFKERVDSQQAHGLQELEFIQGHTNTEAARMCVDQWLKMPGLKPGTVNPGRKAVLQRPGPTPANSNPILCPVMHCNRKFDNGHLLLGHLKRFDHSPCDPTITLHGPPANAFACVVCYKRFVTSQQYSEHVLSKESQDDGHKINLPPQLIRCFACPYCFLLFSLRDECLQHMSVKKHFLQFFKLSEETVTPLPLAFPSYAKNLLISLCKEIPFQVKCTSCRQTLRSHVELTAHFRTRCRNAGPVALSEKSISQVAQIFKSKGHCRKCDKLFVADNHIKQHSHTTGHKVKSITTMEESILTFCHLNEGNKSPSQLRKFIKYLKSSPLKRPLIPECSGDKTSEVISKRIKDIKEEKQDSGVSPTQGSGCTIKAWTCECQLKFPAEELVEKHIFSANRVCHKCGVCGKLAENSSIIRLHMSRFHGGAHLANFTFWCRACSVELQREDNVMAHITEFHGGHSYYHEQDIPEEEPMQLSSDLPCSNSDKQEDRSPSPMTSSPLASPMEQSPERDQILGKWQCNMCEEMFESEDSIKQHCVSLESHHFHRYSCGLCKETFRKAETLYRHCQDLHNGVVQTKYFCGFCGDLFFDVEEEFLIHYKGFHSTNYTCISEETKSSIKTDEVLENSNLLSCGCRESYFSKENRKAAHEKCRNAMLEKGNLWYRCCLCSATSQNRLDLTAHLASHPGKPAIQQMYVVRCGACSKNFHHLEGAHQHFHIKHCFLQKLNVACFGSQTENKVFHFTASGASMDKKPDKLQAPAPTQSDVDDSNLPDLDYLCTMTHIVLMDLDNWGSFFQQLPTNLNQGTFVWGFQGGGNNWKPPVKCRTFNYLTKIGCFFLHPHCSTRREAADFAICVHVGRLDQHLPKQIPFTVLSGDKSFSELEDQLKMTQRTVHILNPHKVDGEIMCALLNSISDTAKGS
uniref:Zinc finger protein 451 n=1 Tax=Sphenodon punctatus TaxID=8508 RepID=A0A8D0GQ48_SPHPU